MSGLSGIGSNTDLMVDLLLLEMLKGSLGGSSGSSASADTSGSSGATGLGSSGDSSNPLISLINEFESLLLQLAQAGSSDSADSTGALTDTADSSGALADSADSYGADSYSDSSNKSLAVSTATGSSALSSSAPAETQQYKQYIEEASQKYGVPADLIAAEIEQESSGDANAVSNNPAMPYKDEGLMQVDTNTYAEDIQKYDPSLTGNNLYDPRTNIMAGTAYLAELYKQNGSWSSALQEYNGGYDTQYVQEALQHLSQMGSNFALN